MLRHRRRAEQELAEAQDLKRAYQEKVEAFEEEKEGTLSSSARELDAFLRDSQARVEQLLAQLNATRDEEAARAAYRELTEVRRQLREKGADAERHEAPPGWLHVGGTVYVRSVDADGQVLHILPRGKVAVDLSGIRLTTDVQDIEPSKGRKKERAKKGEQRTIRISRNGVPLQLNVRAMTVAEALRDVETYLDQLLLSDIKHASILHGKGTGALRDAIRNYLSSCSFISSYGPGTPREGGEGITVFTIGGG